LIFGERLFKLSLRRERDIRPRKNSVLPTIRTFSIIDWRANVFEIIVVEVGERLNTNFSVMLSHKS
jgi:hypothetical protein